MAEKIVDNNLSEGGLGFPSDSKLSNGNQKLRSPFSCAVSRTASFPYYSNGNYHGGEDYVVSGDGSWDLCAVDDGVILCAYMEENVEDGLGKDGYHYWTGNYIFYKCDSGLYVTYCHLESIRTDILDKINNQDFDTEKGIRITRGQYLGTGGTTGHSTGRHLHIEVSSDYMFHRKVKTDYYASVTQGSNGNYGASNKLAGSFSSSNYFNNFNPKKIGRASVYIDFNDYSEITRPEDVTSGSNGNYKKYKEVIGLNYKNNYKFATEGVFDVPKSYKNIYESSIPVYSSITDCKSGFTSKAFGSIELNNIFDVFGTVEGCCIVLYQSDYQTKNKESGFIKYPDWLDVPGIELNEKEDNDRSS